MSETKAKLHRRFTGEVVSAKMQKTVTVLVSRVVRHKVYGKQYAISRKYKVHDEKGTCHMGDKVTIEECRPISRDKRWRVVKGKTVNRLIS